MMDCQGFLEKYYLMKEGGDFFKNTKCSTFTGHHERPIFAAIFYFKVDEEFLWFCFLFFFWSEKENQKGKTNIRNNA
jgi:hypothetical protein